MEYSEISIIQTELANSLGVSKAKMNNLAQQYKLQGIQSGNTVKYPSCEVKRLLEEMGQKKKCRVITVNNIKGGVGKTIFTRELAYALAQHGAKTLMIDLDLQGTLSLICGVYNDELPTWKNVIKGEVEASELIIPIKENLSIISCNIGAGGIDREIGNKNIALLVKQYIESLKEEYDAIVFDTRPEVSNINLAAIIASDVVIVPTKADAGSQKGIGDTFREIDLAEKEYSLYLENKKIKRSVIVNLFKQNRTTEMTKFVDIYNSYSDQVFPECLNDNTDMAQAYNEGKFLYELKRISPVNKFMRKLAVDLLELNSTKRSQEGVVNVH